MLTFLKLNERERRYSTMCERLDGPCQKVKHVILAHFPLTGIQSHSDSNHKEALGNTAPKEGHRNSQQGSALENKGKNGK